ncbi:Vta1 like-domain-containing protein [Massariosphaeria phaeospora]|uniref:Vta1 like-domain-containing protein n=1 Tax=Massariosphaeria phaeospora TaxID=100035 RepID=A0A7C8IC93_9PLEO|nr:Vta1 like-domain-containing protein [Massariosphaeria phaeospora]
MAATVPAKLKDIAVFAKRAAQLERFEPIVTYWLRFYMTQKIIRENLHLADAECTAYATDLMEGLERTKAEHATEDALLDEVAAYAYCEQFALKTFAKGEREMETDSVTKATPDTLMAASTFFEILSIWKPDLDLEIKSKQKYAKFHALRILKAQKNGEDPNFSNPVREPPPPAMVPPPLDPDDPEVQDISGGTLQPDMRNPFQPYVESVPNTSVQPSPTFSAQRVSPPPNLPSAPTGYTQSSHRDVSPISQPATSRQGSVVSVGGGYFPRVDVPTFTADTAAPRLPTAPSGEDEPMTSPLQGSTLPSGSQLPQAPQAPDAQSFYQNAASPAPVQQPPPQHFQSAPPQPTFLPPPSQPAQQPSFFQPNPMPPPQHHQYPPRPTQPVPSQPPPQHYAQQIPPAQPAQRQGPFTNDEEAISLAQKHAKWAISALNFEDVNTAVSELRAALQTLGAN